MPDSQNTFPRHFRYTARTRYAGILWSAVYLLGLAGLTTATVLSGTRPSLAYITILALASPLFLLGLLAQKRLSNLLQPVTVEADGLRTRLSRNKEVEVFVPWNEIVQAEVFRWPDADARKLARHAGLRLLTAGEKIVIYDHIQGFEVLRELVRQGLARHGRPGVAADLQTVESSS